MEITGAIAVPELSREAYYTWFGRHPRVGERYLAAVVRGRATVRARTWP
jgi:hypothetical protein